MDCKECGNEMELIDTTVSNIDTDRSKVGQHTGDIYKCEDCDIMILDNLLTGQIERWTY